MCNALLTGRLETLEHTRQWQSITLHTV